MSFLPWGVILAGGDGTRLKALSRSLAGDDRPKQFCVLFGNKSLLARTRDRLEPAISRDRMVFAVVQEHAPYFRSELADVDESRIVIQPVNRGTTAAIIYSLLRLTRLEKDPIVAFFPSDHHFADETQFARAVDRAFEVVRRHRDRLVVVGAEAQEAEVEYGWIEPGPPVENAGAGALPVFHVERFWEKPSAPLAEVFLKSGCLHNTFVMAGRAWMFLEVLEAAMPDAVAPFHAVAASRGTEEEAGRAAQVYDRLAVSDFSRDVMTRCAGRLAVVRMEGAGWDDLGTPERVYRTIRRASGAGIALASGPRVI